MRPANAPPLSSPAPLLLLQVLTERGIIPPEGLPSDAQLAELSVADLFRFIGLYVGDGLAGKPALVLNKADQAALRPWLCWFAKHMALRVVKFQDEDGSAKVGAHAQSSAFGSEPAQELVCQGVSEAPAHALHCWLAPPPAAPWLCRYTPAHALAWLPDRSLLPPLRSSSRTVAGWPDLPPAPRPRCLFLCSSC